MIYLRRDSSFNLTRSRYIAKCYSIYLCVIKKQKHSSTRKREQEKSVRETRRLHTVHTHTQIQINYMLCCCIRAQEIACNYLPSHYE